MATERIVPARRRMRPATMFQLVAAIAVAVFALFPLLWLFTGGFKTQTEASTGAFWPSHPTLDNFVFIFTQVPFLRYLLNSFFVSAIVTVVALFFHSMAAYALARLRFRGRDTVFMLVFATLLVTAPVILVPLFVVVRELHMLNNYAGLIVPALFNAFGIFLLRQYYITIPKELEEAAIVDGCGYWRVYWNMILPLSRPILAALTVFFFLANWNAFVWPLIVLADDKYFTVQVGLQLLQDQVTVGGGANWSYLLAGSTLTALPDHDPVLLPAAPAGGVDQDLRPQGLTLTNGLPAGFPVRVRLSGRACH
ncbi:carbohydrate ABC transporter permease [Fodinicola feengrottensis]|uniref:carbohydrate ABC transporter permease n=1 Tax=Fodinicola feengrottensis TaxID=435914 RepID=UPI0024429901|nr:carbohydrate ABC transporter permease [Fodinicola feengrottensis]